MAEHPRAAVISRLRDLGGRLWATQRAYQGAGPGSPVVPFGHGLEGAFDRGTLEDLDDVALADVLIVLE
ncbi:MAG: hypothetical protein AAFR79_16655, partial [Pseudomonadota bacterium]